MRPQLVTGSLLKQMRRRSTSGLSGPSLAYMAYTINNYVVVFGKLYLS